MTRARRFRLSTLFYAATGCSSNGPRVIEAGTAVPWVRLGDGTVLTIELVRRNWTLVRQEPPAGADAFTTFARMPNLAAPLLPRTSVSAGPTKASRWPAATPPLPVAAFLYRRGAGGTLLEDRLTSHPEKPMHYKTIVLELLGPARSESAAEVPATGALGLYAQG